MTNEKGENKNTMRGKKKKKGEEKSYCHISWSDTQERNSKRKKLISQVQNPSRTGIKKTLKDSELVGGDLIQWKVIR
jgi:hypothetical protein